MGVSGKESCLEGASEFVKRWPDTPLSLWFFGQKSLPCLDFRFYDLIIFKLTSPFEVSLRGACMEERMKSAAIDVGDKITVPSTDPTVAWNYPCLQTLNLLFELQRGFCE